MNFIHNRVVITMHRFKIIQAKLVLRIQYHKISINNGRVRNNLRPNFS